MPALTLSPEQTIFQKNYGEEAVALLKQLIATPSFSREENATATLIENFLKERGIETCRHNNNVWARNKHFSAGLPALLLNSHHDTVKPNSGYTRDPFLPVELEGKLFGLGSNDAGGALVSLLMTFMHFYNEAGLPYNIIFAATAEEEISGKGGVESILPKLGTISIGIVGEPTKMEMAIAEKGLLVLDCLAQGKSGHAAHGVSDNAIYKAMRDIEWFRKFKFPQTSTLLGEIKMNVTVINAGSAHNVVPDKCSFTVDVRTTDAYSTSEVLSIIRQHVTSEVKPRSVRLHPSSISTTHPLVKAANTLGIRTYGSPTTSDQALMPFDTVKIGPGDSLRSHSSDEFIYTNEISEGIKKYISILNTLFEREN
jgi:acetylornithine deacetylase